MYPDYYVTYVPGPYRAVQPRRAADRDRAFVANGVAQAGVAPPRPLTPSVRLRRSRGVSKSQEDREQWAGDQFIAWYNKDRGTAFQYVGRGDRSPDLLYRDGR